MIRHQIARILSAIADRIEPERTVEIQYVYVGTGNAVPYTVGPYKWTSGPNICRSN